MNVDLEARISCIRNIAAIAKAAQNALKENIISFLRDTENDLEPLTFNDETGFPVVIGESGGSRLVVAVRVRTVNGTPTIEFNDTCGDDDYGLDPDGWYNPDTCGHYDLEGLFGCIVEALKD